MSRPTVTPAAPPVSQVRPCVLADFDAAQGCDATALAKLRADLDARAGLGPLWAPARALFAPPRRCTSPVIGMRGRRPTSRPCRCAAATSSSASGPVPSGLHAYKLVDASAAWSLDPTNHAFAYDDYTGNPDGINSVLDTPDSGVGHLVRLDDACSTTLGNCRAVTAYLPPGYDAPEAAQRAYPVMFMHDGQNLWDDHDCCFGHNRLGSQRHARRGDRRGSRRADHRHRCREHGEPQQRVRPRRADDAAVHRVPGRRAAAARTRAGPRDGKRVAIVGSSLGGLVAMELGLRHPDIYASAARYRGAFWPRMDVHTALRDELPGMGKQSLAIYLDHGGDPPTTAMAPRFDRGSRSARQPGLAARRLSRLHRGAERAVYDWTPNATHDELAWKARVWRFLRSPRASLIGTDDPRGGAVPPDPGDRGTCVRPVISPINASCARPYTAHPLLYNLYMMKTLALVLSLPLVACVVGDATPRRPAMTRAAARAPAAVRAATRAAAPPVTSRPTRNGRVR